MIDTQLLVTGVIFGLSLGSIFFLMAVGLSLCFGLMRIISLDQLLYYSVGAYIAYSVSLTLGPATLTVPATEPSVLQSEPRYAVGVKYK